MATKTAALSFLNDAAKMSIAQVKQLFEQVVMKTAPKDMPPVILWGNPGIAKSAIIEQVFGKSDKGLKTVILSQIGPLDTNGLPHIAGMGTDDKQTEFTPTNTFGRGKQNLFLDELNNCAPSTLAAVQNLLSSREMGGDSYKDVYIVAACNPPSTNSLANDLNFPTMSRCLNIIVDYTLTDFINYAMASGKMHPAITAFHNKTGGAYLEASWCGVKRGVDEPSVNEPFPCPRSWELASNLINAMSSNKNAIPYSMLQPLVQGVVGVAAAQEFAQTYAYMDKIPDVDAIYNGTLSKFTTSADDSVVVKYVTTFNCVNYISQKVNQLRTSGAKMIFTSPDTEAYKVAAGIYNMAVFIGSSMKQAELATLFTKSVTNLFRGAEAGATSKILAQLYTGLDPKNGFTREGFTKYLSQASEDFRDFDAALNK